MYGVYANVKRDVGIGDPPRSFVLRKFTRDNQANDDTRAVANRREKEGIR